MCEFFITVEEMSAVGFDIGSENSYIAVVKSGGIEIVDNEFSLRSTPTYIGFTEKCRDIGVSARSKLMTNLQNTVLGFKRILGKKHADAEVKDELTYLPIEEACELPSGNVGIKVKYLKNTTIFSIQQLMAMILTKLKIITESKLGNKIRDCVIAVPVYYTDAQRRAMLDAVNIAGLNAVKLINESTAIALSYGFFKQNLSDEESQNVVFVDLGKSCLTVTACVFTRDKCKILGFVWDYVGGRDFDNKLVQYFIDDFKKRYNLDVLSNKKALMSLILECEVLKKVMSVNPLEVTLQIECFMNDYDVVGKIKREKFEELSEQVLNKIEMNFHRLLEKIQLTPSDIHSVEIVGGSSRVPAVKERIKKTFGCKPNETLNQDEAVARGCALQCAILSPSLKTRDYIVDDMPSYIIKMTWINKESNQETLELFSFSDKIPSFKLVTIGMSKPFLVKAFYVDSEEKICKIGKFVFGSIPEDVEKSGVMKVKIKVCLNIHGIFNVESAKIIKRIEENEQSDKIVPCVDNTNIAIPMHDKEEEISAPEQLAVQNVQANCAVKYYEISIESQISGLTELELNEFIDTEQRMICKDVEEKENADARNVLEEFVYDLRGKLHDELEEFVLEEDKTALLETLKSTEMWVDANEELETAEYIKKLNYLKSLSNPILQRYTEWKQKQIVIDNYRQSLQQAFNAFNNFMSKDGSTDPFEEDDVQNLLRVWEESKQYLDQYVEKVSQSKKTDDVPIKASELQSSLKDFKAKFHDLFVEMQKKRSAERKIRDPSFGDGENSSVNDLPNDIKK